MLGLGLGIPLGWLLLVVGFLALRLISDALGGIGLDPGDKQKFRSFPEIKVGMSSEQVTALMAEEGKRSDTFYLGQQTGYEFEYEVGKRIGAAYFLAWNAFDHVFIVAIDHEDRVIYKASGGT